MSTSGPKLWNDVINKEEKDIQSLSLFQNKIKSKLIKIGNKNYFFNKMLMILKPTNFISVYC